MSELTDRINFLARKKKAVGLTDAEIDEQARLREEFRRLFRANFEKQVTDIKIVRPDGTEEKPQKKI